MDRQSQTCVLKGLIHLDMDLAEARQALSPYGIVYHGREQTADIYYVHAPTCHALLHFDVIDDKLDIVDYGSGQMEISSRLPGRRVTEGGHEEKSAQKIRGVIDTVPENVFVNAYVLANAGTDDLDTRQLEQLAPDEYRMRKQSPEAADLGDVFLNTRGKRALDYLYRMQKTQQ